MHPLLSLYNSVAIPKLQENFTYSSKYAIPHITKVVVNMGTGDCLGNSKALEDVVALLSEITGQKPAETKSRKAISGFKIRENMIVGLKVTLRGTRMYDFLIKLTQVALPRTRDFRGLVPTSITSDGNLNIGIKDSMIFPESAQSNTNHGMQITLVSTAKSLEEARTLYESLGFVFQSAEEAAERKKRTRTHYKRG